MDKEQFYQMRLQRDIFESRKTHRDTDFSFKVIDNNNPLHIRDNISHLKFICKSISKELPDWEGKPALDICLERLNSISSLFLFFHKDFNKAINNFFFSFKLVNCKLLYLIKVFLMSAHYCRCW